MLVATVALVVLATSLAGTVALRSYLVDRLDAQLRETVAAPLDARGGPAPGRRGPPARRRGDGAAVRRRRRAAGRLVRGAAPLGRSGRRGPEPPAGPADRGRRRRRGHSLASPRPADGRRRGARRRGPAVRCRGDRVGQLLLINAAVGLLALAGGGVLAAWAVRRSLRPLVRVEETAEAIAAGDLSVRVPAADPRTEVGSLSASFNAMVDRFETAWAGQQQSEAQARASEGRMRQFVADAGHELRTPLTSIRGFAELYRQGAARDPEQLSGVLRRIEDEAARMGLLVEDLLLLARLDQHRPLRREPVRPAQRRGRRRPRRRDRARRAPRRTAAGPTPVEACRSCLRRRRPAAPGREQPGRQRRRPHRRRHGGRRGGPARRGRGGARGARRRGRHGARGRGAGLRALLPRGRLPQSGGAATGSGLGLSIVAGIVAAHGGTVDVDTAVGAGTRFTVRLPAGDPPDPPPLEPPDPPLEPSVRS